ncbi:hypothetical protein [Paenibacillus turpanensis]|uniref:hypothetical protein n=1 Tax=Paenibacillus turpanensis TaxID=2689078 RepID=UPI00140C1926|nr:hypothetical protein [Paenibacillus turpanensis]
MQAPKIILGILGRFFEVEISEHNPYVPEAFEIAGNGSFRSEDRENLENHSMMVYLLAEGGSSEKVIDCGTDRRTRPARIAK